MGKTKPTSNKFQEVLSGDKIFPSFIDWLKEQYSQCAKLLGYDLGV
ncbi:MAG: hypothetical protein H8E64_08010 [Candidatus Marinimicrobia bacterium]|nr:hypothetical protein [Candidatus Neomarinimicrobiota bacterium]